MQRILAPSLLSADFGNLQRDVQMIDHSAAQWLHLDIMDGVFVPNISFGFPIITHVRKYTAKPLDVHLMIVDPDRYIDRFAQAGANYLTVHYEACRHLHRTVSQIRQAGMHPGVALNPHTPPELLVDLLPDLDLVLIMSVNPGFGGQKFIPQALHRVERLYALAQQSNPSMLIEVDGGVSVQNAASLWQAGAQALVAGNAVFGASDPLGAISDILCAE